MGLTASFGESLEDPDDDQAKVYLEVGRTTWTGEERMYVTVGDKSVILDTDAAKRFCEAIDDVRFALNLGKR